MKREVDIVVHIPEEALQAIKEGTFDKEYTPIELLGYIQNGTPLTPNILADLLMEERIRGELKQDISCSKDIIRDVKCRLTVDIIDHRPCYCGAELREVWRESEK